MSSPNVFLNPVLDGGHCEQRRPRQVSGMDSPQRGEALSTLSTAASSAQSLHLPHVSPLNYLTLCRGRARYRVKPYSVQHAYLTGRTGTPTWHGKPLAGSLSCRLMGAGAEKQDGYSTDEQGPSTPAFRVKGRLEWSCADVAAASTFGQLDGSPDTSAHDDAANTPKKRLGSGQESTDTDEEDAGDEDRTDSEYASTNGEDEEDDDRSGEATPRAQTISPLRVHVPHARFLRSPYDLRRPNPTGRARVQEQLNPVGLPMDLHFLKQANIKKVNPAIKVVRSMQALLFRCTTFLAIGITLAQFGKITRQCMKCDRYTFVESFATHDCKAAAYDPTANEFSIIQAIYSSSCPGMDDTDIEQVFMVCDTCRRVYMRKYSYMHDCNQPGDADDADVEADV